jgi:hypothetical protein
MLVGMVAGRDLEDASRRVLGCHTISYWSSKFNSGFHGAASFELRSI